VFLTSALVSDWSASRPGRFIPLERAPGTHWMGGWVGPRTRLEALEPVEGQSWQHTETLGSIQLICTRHSEGTTENGPSLYVNQPE
jgi:hypothetical protein